MIKIYGSPLSSAGRCYVTLEEIGIPYERVPLDMTQREHKAPEFLALNPNGKVPCLLDGDFTLWESVAINAYLADKYKPELLGTTPKERALVNQWSLWALQEPQPPLVTQLIQVFFTPADKRDEKVVEKAKADVLPKLDILENYLQKKSYMVADRFTLADINVGSVVNICRNLQNKMDAYPKILGWLETLTTRESWQKVSRMPR